MTPIYKDHDADLQCLQGRTIAIIGYGNQGRAQALNMRDTGIRNILIGTTKPPSEHRARKDGFPVLSVAEASRQADILFVLVPDEVMPAICREQIEPGLAPGKLLNFASGYNVTFRLIVPPPSVDVVMLAPRMIGDGVRNLFLSGEGYPAFVAVHQDATGRAKPTVLALAKAIGATKKGAIEVTFKDETMLDLLAEQAIWPLIMAVLIEAFRFETEKGHPVEASLMELYLSKEHAYMLEKMAEVGLFKQMPYHSHTSQYGQLSRYETLDKSFIRQTLEKAYAFIESGGFAEEWKREQAAGLPEYNRLIQQAFASDISKLEAPFVGGTPETTEAPLSIDEPVVTEHLVRAAIRKQATAIRVSAAAVITPSALDVARENRVAILRADR
jgi:ketol-acid reductoisomerase